MTVIPRYYWRALQHPAHTNPHPAHRACAIALAAPNRPIAHRIAPSPLSHTHPSPLPLSYFSVRSRKDFAIAVGNASHGNLFTYTHGNFSMDTKVETAST